MPDEHGPCEQWREKRDAYVDGELDSADAAGLAAHIRVCARCANDVLERVQMKRSVQLAGKRFAPSAEFRNRISKNVAVRPARKSAWLSIVAVPALSVIILSAGVNLYARKQSEHRQLVYSELADLHVAALAGASPVDVVSSDRHTVKPWFQGRIPFTFNLPELQGSEFTLLGGRVTYLAQTPGAHLIYQLRKHEISVFIFQDRGEPTADLPAGTLHTLSFNAENWRQNGLRYFVLGEVGAADIKALSKLLRDAA
ncbi:MAG TPA: zf-HC2 domain-containing protein [Candidatus Sulfotelmatobacter sp.]|jgi:anti-sigma factor RsiW